MKAFLFLNLLFSFLQMSSQNSPFIVEYVNQPLSNKTQFLKAQDSVFYEDAKYIVTNNCYGEFGGTITFKEKLSGIEYGCKSQCAVIINKLNGRYYISNTLSHGNTFSEILEIKDPKLLESASNKEFSNFTKIGSKTISEIDDYAILLSFPYKNKLYHIITDDSKSYLVEIIGNEYKILNILSENKGLYIFNPQIINRGNNHFLLFDKDEEEAGFLEVFENKITITTYKT